MVDLYRPISEGLLTEEPTRFSDMYGAGATGLLFAPGAGVTDLMGYAPDPAQPGEYLPSFGENIREGNYLDAALQTLGGAGDVMMAGGAFVPPLVGVGAAMKAPRAIRAYHGSPYDFDRFDLNKIGSGEGAQAFGHGLYFTDSEDIAEGYRKNTRGLRDLRSGIDVSYKGSRSEGLGDSLEDEAAKAVIYHMTKPSRSRYPDQAKEKAIQSAQKNIEDFSAPEMAEVLGAEDQALYVERLKRELKAVSEINPDDFDISQGKTYEVEISAAPEGLLDYDARLKDQNPEIKKRVRDMVENEMTEMDAVNLGYDLGEEVDLKGAKDFMLSGDTTVDQFLGNWQALRGSTDAGEFLLNKYGIPGLQYSSEGTRDQKFLVKLDVRGKPYRETDPIYARDMQEAKSIEADYKDKGFGVEIEDIREKNYVIFDDSLISILRKYGLLAPLVGGGTAAAVMGAEEPQPAGGIL